ncbi:hypothetical protein PCANC_28927, partial [Puccinia coronata f. sp. avenae]
MSDQGNQELTNHWNNPQLAPNPFPLDQSSSNHSAFQMNHNYGDYHSNHNYVDPCGLPTLQQRQSNNQQQASQATPAIPPPNSQVLPNKTLKKRAAPRVQAHEQL